jgi:hypothetical protein
VYALAQVSPVTIVKTLPILKADIDAVFLGRVTATSLEEHRATEQFPNQLIEELIKNSDPSLRPITVMDPANLICTGGTCAVTLNLTVMYKDDNHITPQGSLLYEGEIIKFLQK